MDLDGEGRADFDGEVRVDFDGEVPEDIDGEVLAAVVGMGAPDISGVVPPMSIGVPGKTMLWCTAIHHSHTPRCDPRPIATPSILP